MNASAPIDLEQFLRLDEGSRLLNVYQNWLLYTSLTISILVAALAMAAKLWVVRYSREVTTSGPPRASAKRRQEVHDGLVAWRMQNYIDATPLLALTAVLLFVFFIQSVNSFLDCFVSLTHTCYSSSVPVKQAGIAYFVSVVFNIGFAFIIISSFSAAFIPDSPFRSPFSDFVGFIPKIIPNKPVSAFMSKHPLATWRTVGNFLTSTPLLAAGGYFLVKGNSASFPCVYWAIAGVFALMQKGRETDTPPRLFGLPLWLFLSSTIVFACFMLSLHFNERHSTPLCITFFTLGAFLLIVLGGFGVKMSETRPMTVEADAVSWLLKTSTNKDPAWFQKAVQIAGESSNARALLVEKLLPLLLPLITSLPYSGQATVTHEQESYINTLAVLMDFEPRRKSFRRNEASLKLPHLPEELIDRLEELQLPAEKCLHKGANSKEKWNDGSLRCPVACVNDAVHHILLLQARVDETRAV